MGKSFVLFIMIMISSVFTYGCSREENRQDPVKDAKIAKKAIVRPMPQRPEVLPSEPQMKEGTASLVQPEEKKSSEDLTPPTSRAVEKKQDRPGAETASREEAKSAHVKPAVKSLSPSDAAPESLDKQKAYYPVKKGETLAGIAGKKEIYGDPLKWPVLYRSNASALESLPATDNLPDLPLPDSVKLEIITPEEIKRNLEKRSGGVWVVNVLSATTNSEVIPAVISLVRNHYPVYITTARVNQKDWMRVRVGFFTSKEEAEAEGKRIMGIMRFRDSWVTKLTKAEFSEFAGY